MKYVAKLPHVHPSYRIPSDDDKMYLVMEYGETMAYIVETIDGTRQSLYFLDGSERHFELTSIEDIAKLVPSKSKFKMAWSWLEDNGYIVRADEGNGFLEVEVTNMDGTDSVWIGMSELDIEWKAMQWRDSKKDWMQSTNLEFIFGRFEN